MPYMRLTRSEQFLLIQRVRDGQRPVDRATGRRVQAALKALGEEAIDAAMDAVRQTGGAEGVIAAEQWLRADHEPARFSLAKDVVEFLYDDVKGLTFPRHLAKIWGPLLDKIDTAYENRNQSEPALADTDKFAT